ncbi:MAG: hypothetical protein QXQ57_02670 [Sulfolobales archaeon]
MWGSVSTSWDKVSIYGLEILSPRILSTLTVLLAILVSLRAFSPDRLIGYLMDLYFVIVVIIAISIAIKRNPTIELLLKPDIASLIASVIYAIAVGGYVPVMVALFTILIVLSSKYVEEVIGHWIFPSSGAQKDLGYIGGSPGSHVKLYPGVITACDLVISKGSIVVREPYNSDTRSYREAGDIVAGYSSVESGSAEALIINSGSIFQGGRLEAQAVSKRICGIFSTMVYIVSFLGLAIGSGTAVYLSIAAPSIPYIYFLYMARRSSDLARIGIISWKPRKTSREICGVRELYLDAGSIVYARSTGEISIRSRSSLAREEIMKIMCSASEIEALRNICKGYEDHGRNYTIVRRGPDLVILEDTRTRVRICISTPDKARIYGFQWDISTIDPNSSCQGITYIISTRYEILGYICVSRSFSISNMMSLSKLARDHRVSVILDSGDIEILSRSSSEIKKILESVELRIKNQRDGESCPEKNTLAVMRDIPANPCRGVIYIVDPKQASKRYSDLRTSLAKGAAIIFKKDINWLERIPWLCRRWKRDLGLIIATYIILRGGGAMISIVTGILWAQYILEVASYAISMFRIYSH